jgi:hypothetical protein
VAGAIGRGLAVGLGVGIGDGVAGPALLATTVGLGVGVGDGVAGPALLVTTVGLGVAVLEQAAMASSREKIDPIRARRPVRTLSSQIIYVAVAP